LLKHSVYKLIPGENDEQNNYSSLLATTIAAFSVQAQAAGEAKNVIFFLGDGMGPRGGYRLSHLWLR
jgi:alkaline phosphatase